jgi:hypothetical protein
MIKENPCIRTPIPIQLLFSAVGVRQARPASILAQPQFSVLISALTQPFAFLQSKVLKIFCVLRSSFVYLTVMISPIPRGMPFIWAMNMAATAS